MEPPNNTENIPQLQQDENHDVPAEEKLPEEAMNPQPELPKLDASAAEIKPENAPAESGFSEMADVPIEEAPLE